MPPRRTEGKREKILDAAVGVFSRKGFFASRVSDVAAAAGIADGTVYLYFRSKDDILISVFDETMSEHLVAAQKELAQAEDVRARLKILADHHLGLLGKSPELAVVFQVELRQSTKFMELFTASWLMDYFDLIERTIERGQRRGAIRADVPRKLAAHAFFGALDALVTSWVLSRNAFDLTALAGPMVDLFLSGAAARAARPSAKKGSSADVAGLSRALSRAKIGRVRTRPRPLRSR
jgi:TetR/AcrR family fatty acid metabolism transcriptional regulator